MATISSSAATPGATPIRLAKVVGVLAILASGVSQEYGSGINYVLVNSLGTYPDVKWLVPIAMVVAGIVLLPKVVMFMRFARVMPRAGSTYVWLARSLNLPVGFAVAFLWFIGVGGSMGFLAFSFASFLASTFDSLGLAGGWAVTPTGHIVLGLVLIWVVFGLHYTGVRNYGTFVTVILGIVLVAAAIVVVYGFTTSQETFLKSAAQVLGSTPSAPATQVPSMGSFISVVTLFMFAYGGLTASTSLGGEARDATRTMPRGIFLAWLTAFVLFSVVSLALFHAVPWWTVETLVKSKHAELATTPGLIGMVAPHAVAALVNFLVMLIVGKTVAPDMMDCSRYLFAWAQDGLLPAAFLHTAKSKAPDVALFTAGILGSLFLVEATFFGWSIGVALRSVTLVVVFGMLGIGVLNMRFNKAFHDRPWAAEITRHSDIVVAAVLAIIIALVLLSSVLVVPGTPFLLQPTTQAVVGVIIAVVLYRWAAAGAKQRGKDIYALAREQLPAE